MKTIDKILSREQLIEKVAEWKLAGKKIVFTNGCFDIVHLGHIDYLEKASHFGDILIVGMNSDNSVGRLKGPQRPIIHEESRSRVMASFIFVDVVCLFDEETPYDLIKAVKPDILVKGNDYTIENIVGADLVIDNGGKVCTVELVQGFSTTSIINKIVGNQKN